MTLERRDLEILALLERVLLALDRGDPREACVELREAWHLSKDPDLADCYALLTREFQAPPLAGRNPEERAASWRQRAEAVTPGDPLVLPVLLAEPWFSGDDEDLRLERLDRWSPDPQLAEALAETFGLPARASNTHPGEWGASGAWRRLDMLERQADPRQLHALAMERRIPLRTAVQRVEATLRRIHPVVLRGRAAAAAARVRQRTEPRRSFERRSAELLAAVHAAPDLDDPRLVYADWLTAHGDPRGEFITLQLGPHSGVESSSPRERELLERHAHEWLGRLHRLLGAHAFARGFLTTASVEVADLDGPIVEASEWSTLQILDGHPSHALIRRGPLEHLTELYGYLRLDRFVAARADNRLPAVRRYECSIGDPNLGFETPLGLEALIVRDALDDALIRLLESPAIARLAQLGVYYSSASTVAVDHRERRSARHRVELLRDRLASHVRRLQLIDDDTARASRPRGWLLTFERDELDRFTRVRLDWRQPAHGQVGADAVDQGLAQIDEIGLGTVRRIELGEFDDPTRSLLLDGLRDRLDRLARDGGIDHELLD